MSRAVTLAGYAVLLVAMVGYQLIALRASTADTLGEWLVWLRRHWIGRSALAAGWLWLGWHLFVRASH